MIAAQLSKTGFRGTKLPWYNYPFRLISWFEMNQFSAEIFYGIGLSLGRLSQALHLKNTVGSPSCDFPQVGSGQIFIELRRIKKEARKIHLIQTAKQATHWLEKFKTDSELLDGKLLLSDVQTSIDGLKRLIHSEMEEHLFLWVPPLRADAYTQKKPFFGKLVSDKFPSASLDIEEVGKCFGCGRYTAAVMHCMRVLEHGLRALCLALELPFGEKSWQRSLQAIEARIVVLDSQVNPKRKAAWKTKRQFYSEAIKEFTHFKDAWRNHAAHGREHYDDERADKITEHTRSFMQVLVTRLREKKS